MLSPERRAVMASDIIHYMRETYEAEGENGDFEDGERYLRDDASEEELQAEHARWVPVNAS